MDSRTIDLCKSVFEKLASATTRELEAMSSLVFLKNAKIAQSNDDLVKKVHFYKRHISEAEIRKHLDVFEMFHNNTSPPFD